LHQNVTDSQHWFKTYQGIQYMLHPLCSSVGPVHIRPPGALSRPLLLHCRPRRSHGSRSRQDRGRQRLRRAGERVCAASGAASAKAERPGASHRRRNSAARNRRRLSPPCARTQVCWYICHPVRAGKQCCGSKTKVSDPACSLFRIRIRIRLRILDLDPDQKPAKTFF
jgi:hypothetical protein